jgi:hypothetical protein
MASAVDVRGLAERIAQACDEAVRLLGEKHPVAEALLRALKDMAHVMGAARTT